jgi:hypothetical protein
MSDEQQESYLSRAQAAAYCKERGVPCSVGTLEKFAVKGGGPYFKKWHNGRTLYPKDKLEAWITAQITDPQPTAAVA